VIATSKATTIVSCFYAISRRNLLRKKQKRLQEARYSLFRDVLFIFKLWYLCGDVLMISEVATHLPCSLTIGVWNKKSLLFGFSIQSGSI